MSVKDGLFIVRELDQFRFTENRMLRITFVSDTGRSVGWKEISIASSVLISNVRHMSQGD
jgi:hypothetical protein